MSGNLYELLGSRSDAGSSELRQDYERALAAAHRCGGTKLAQEIVAAYELLSDPARRRVYDETGIGVPRERVPNAYGPAVPFRGGHPGLGQSRPQRRRQAAAANSGQVRFERKVAKAAQLSEQGQHAAAARAASEAVALGKGVEGEALIAELLNGLVLHGWRVLHDRRKSSTSPANLDHVVVGPPGVLVIDAKNWSGGRLRLDDRGMAIGRYRRDDELQAAKIDGDIVRQILQQMPPGAPVYGVLAFVQDLGLAAPTRHHDVFLVQRNELWNWLWSLPPVLSAEQVRALGHALDGALPPRAGAPARTRSVPRQPRPARSSRRSRANDLRGPLAGLVLLGMLVVGMPHSGPLLNWLSEKLTTAVTPHVQAPQPTPTPRAPGHPRTTTKS
jgi:hypothetical protein